MWIAWGEEVHEDILAAIHNDFIIRVTNDDFDVTKVILGNGLTLLFGRERST